MGGGGGGGDHPLSDKGALPLSRPNFKPNNIINKPDLTYTLFMTVTTR